MMLKPKIVRFLMVLPNTTTDEHFLLKDLPGSGKRIDILCRSLEACFEWGPSNWKRDSIELVSILGNRISLTFRNLPYVPQGEVAWGKIIQEAIRDKQHEFVEYREENIETVLRRILALENSKIWVLEERGIEINVVSDELSSSQNSFMLGDNRGFDSSTYEVIRRLKLPSVSLGNISYLGSHCIALVITHLEKVK